jgi:hypothetical protein
MNHSELSVIKRYQREFKEMFGKTLEIDWNTMNGVEEPVRKTNKLYTPTDLEIDDEMTVPGILESCARRHGADLSIMCSTDLRLNGFARVKERKAMIDFANIVIKNRLNITYAAKLINRDRSCIYYFHEISNQK